MADQKSRPAPPGLSVPDRRARTADGSDLVWPPPNDQAATWGWMAADQDDSPQAGETIKAASAAPPVAGPAEFPLVGPHSAAQIPWAPREPAGPGPVAASLNSPGPPPAPAVRAEASEESAGLPVPAVRDADLQALSARLRKAVSRRQGRRLPGLLALAAVLATIAYLGVEVPQEGSGATDGADLPVPLPATLPGSLELASTPPGVPVSLDGQPRGLTPVVLTGLRPGAYLADFGGPVGSVLRKVTVPPGGRTTAAVVLSPPGSPAAERAPVGWVTAQAPFEVQVFARGRQIGTSRSRRIPLPPGSHELELVAEDVGLRIRRWVEVRPGATATVIVGVPTGLASFNAQPWAEVWIGSRRLGETPLGNVRLPTGQHEVVFRHPRLGERREVLVIRADVPARVVVRFTP